MIDQALMFVLERLNDHLGVDPPEVVLGSVPVDQQSPSVSSGQFGGQVIASVVNIRLDFTHKTAGQPTVSQADAAAVPGYGSTSPGLEILVMFSAIKSSGHYDLALRLIAQVIEFFNVEPVFSAETHPGLRSAGLRKLSFYFQPVTIEELYQIWSISGGRYLPSILYNMKIDFNESGHAV